MKILAIDTSCDDTSVAISEDKKILANVFWSKMKVHDKWGGVVPSEAKRQHIEFLPHAIEEVVKESAVKLEDLDTVAVTYGPGLAIALEAGIEKAKEISKEYEIPLIGVNHMIGHIYSVLAQDMDDFEFPLLALTISGGHTDLYLMQDHLKFKHLGRTLDDAVGEAFDKVGRLLGMGFPAGAKIEQAAKNGDSKAYAFPRPMEHSGDYNWSFSGLKTAVLYQVRKEIGDYEIKPNKKQYKLEDASEALDEQTINNLCASFQQAAIDSIIGKVKKAVDEYNPKMLVVGGGVIANQTLREQLEKAISPTPLHYPKEIWLCTDNAAMIATAAHYYAGKNWYVEDIKKLDRVPNLEI